MTKTVRFDDTIEHRFVHAEGEEPKAMNDIAGQMVRVAQASVPDTDLIASVWRIPAGAEVELSDKDAAKLAALKDAQGVPYVSDPGSPEPDRPAAVHDAERADAERTPRDEAEATAVQAGHTIEGKITDVDVHRAHAESRNVAPGGDAAAGSTPTTPVRGPGPAPAVVDAAQRAAASAQQTDLLAQKTANAAAGR